MRSSRLQRQSQRQDEALLTMAEEDAGEAMGNSGKRQENNDAAGGNDKEMEGQYRGIGDGHGRGSGWKITTESRGERCYDEAGQQQQGSDERHGVVGQRKEWDAATGDATVARKVWL
ncbi:hypothetical protein BHM03_00057144 [Ensete ventricosum]|nr:hypothetical protein BHM03_00057144 [Ensete ventricosum]